MNESSFKIYGKHNTKISVKIIFYFVKLMKNLIEIYLSLLQCVNGCKTSVCDYNHDGIKDFEFL